MSVITSENRAAWQSLANVCSEQRPDVGRKVKVTGGRKHIGKAGVVRIHKLSKYSTAFRYATDAQAQLREMAGRSGYCVLVQPDGGGESFWVDADKVEVQS